MLDKTSTFARLRILRVWQEYLWDISEEDVWKEDYDSRKEFLAAFAEINHIDVSESFHPLAEVKVWCVEFCVIGDDDDEKVAEKTL